MHVTRHDREVWPLHCTALMHFGTLMCRQHLVLQPNTIIVVTETPSHLCTLHRLLESKTRPIQFELNYPLSFPLFFLYSSHLLSRWVGTEPWRTVCHSQRPSQLGSCGLADHLGQPGSLQPWCSHGYLPDHHVSWSPDKGGWAMKGHFQLRENNVE